MNSDRRRFSLLYEYEGHRRQVSGSAFEWDRGIAMPNAQLFSSGNVFLIGAFLHAPAHSRTAGTEKRLDYDRLSSGRKAVAEEEA